LSSKHKELSGTEKGEKKRGFLYYNLDLNAILEHNFCKIILTKRTVMKRITLSLAALCMALILMFSQFIPSSTAVASTVPAPSFSGLTVDGRQFSSSSLKGKAYIVNFFATWCPPCRAEIPDMVAVQKAYASQGFTFVGIAVNEKVPNVKSFMSRNGITYPVLMATPDLIRAFNGYIDGGISGIPTSFVVDASGMVTGVIVGPRSKSQFEQIIRSSISAKAGK